MIKNITQSWKTTLIGFIILIASASSMYYKNASWEEASTGIMLGLGFLICPDDIIKKIKVKKRK